MTHDDLEAGKDFGRYLDVDGDGIPYRTYPGTHPTRGAYFTRGTTKDRYARYSEAGPDYVDNMQRLLRKFETAKTAGAASPLLTPAEKPARFGAIFYGSTSPAMYGGARRARPRAASTSMRCGCAASRSRTRSPISSPRTRGCSWSSRTATRS